MSSFDLDRLLGRSARRSHDGVEVRPAHALWLRRSRCSVTACTAGSRPTSSRPPDQDPTQDALYVSSSTCQTSRAGARALGSARICCWGPAVVRALFLGFERFMDVLRNQADRCVRQRHMIPHFSSRWTPDAQDYKPSTIRSHERRTRGRDRRGSGALFGMPSASTALSLPQPSGVGAIGARGRHTSNGDPGVDHAASVLDIRTPKEYECTHEGYRSRTILSRHTPPRQDQTLDPLSTTPSTGAKTLSS